MAGKYGREFGSALDSANLLGISIEHANLAGTYIFRDGSSDKFYHLMFVRPSKKAIFNTRAITCWGRNGSAPTGSKVFDSVDEAIKTIRQKIGKGYRPTFKGDGLFAIDHMDGKVGFPHEPKTDSEDLTDMISAGEGLYRVSRIPDDKATEDMRSTVDKMDEFLGLNKSDAKSFAEALKKL